MQGNLLIHVHATNCYSQANECIYALNHSFAIVRVHYDQHNIIKVPALISDANAISCQLVFILFLRSHLQGPRASLDPISLLLEYWYQV